MVEFKNDKIRVRCLECMEYSIIQMKYTGTEKQQRSLSFEYEHTFRGGLKCSHCGQEIGLLTFIYEYPKGAINYIDNYNNSCLVIDNIDENNLTLI